MFGGDTMFPKIRYDEEKSKNIPCDRKRCVHYCIDCVQNCGAYGYSDITLDNCLSYYPLREEK